jgi:two-component system, chemotaxis family, CheB/CheR fusion protein
VNLFLETILKNLGTGVAVADADQRIQIWNEQAENMWGLRPDEAQGQHLLNLEIGLPLGELKVPIRTALSGETNGQHTAELEAVNRLGKPVICRVTTMPLRVDGAAGVVLLMENAG